MNDDQPVMNPFENQRREALKHYDEVSSAAYHWSSFVVAAISSYTPNHQYVEDICNDFTLWVQEQNLWLRGLTGAQRKELFKRYLNEHRTL